MSKPTQTTKPNAHGKLKVSIEEVTAIQDLRRFVIGHKAQFNAVEHYRLKEILPVINRALTKLENSI